MWLRIEGSEPSQVELDVHGDPPGRLLVDALVDGGSVPGAFRGQLRIARTGDAVDVDRPISALGLRNGDSLERNARRPSRSRDPEPELVVALGPSAGLSRRLDADVVVGRAAELTVDDPGLSREHAPRASRLRIPVVRTALEMARKTNLPRGPRRGSAADRCLNQTCTRRDSNP